jgi:hypothetical protein
LCTHNDFVTVILGGKQKGGQRRMAMFCRAVMLFSLVTLAMPQCWAARVLEDAPERYFARRF